MKRSLLLAAGLLAVSIVGGILAPPSYSRDALNEMRQMLEPLHSIGPIGLFLFIFLNNSIKAFLAIIFGMFLGLPPLIFTIFNGLTIGAVVAAMKPVVGWAVLTAALAPHGVLEIPLLVLSTALGLMVGLETWKRLAGRESRVKAELRRGIKLYFKWILPGLLVAAAIEAFVTPQVVKLVGG
ncbi:MAG: stage II sporulation protein M [Chloroflexi bacterium]|nr:stage II sporulation protein M [Chloroflexota bacterium]